MATFFEYSKNTVCAAVGTGATVQIVSAFFSSAIEAPSGFRYTLGHARCGNLLALEQANTRSSAAGTFSIQSGDISEAGGNGGVSLVEVGFCFINPFRYNPSRHYFGFTVDDSTVRSGYYSTPLGQWAVQDVFSPNPRRSRRSRNAYGNWIMGNSNVLHKKTGGSAFEMRMAHFENDLVWVTESSWRNGSHQSENWNINLFDIPALTDNSGGMFLGAMA